MGSGEKWFAVRCVFTLDDPPAFEERVTIWSAPTIEDAIERAESEAERYAADDAQYLGIAQAFAMYDVPGDGAEVFSLMRSSGLEADEYIDTFFDTGAERQRTGD